MLTLEICHAQKKLNSVHRSELLAANPCRAKTIQSCVVGKRLQSQTKSHEISLAKTYQQKTHDHNIAKKSRLITANFATLNVKTLRWIQLRLLFQFFN